MIIIGPFLNKKGPDLSKIGKNPIILGQKAHFSV
jgi:hypothetical protein